MLDSFSAVADPRQRRGVRHPFSAILGLALLGLLCRQTEFAAIERWAKQHWHLLRYPLGFTRGKPPHATTLSRTLAKFSLEEFQAAFSSWLQAIVADETLIVAVDGKTSKQGLNPQGNPLQMLHVFAQDLKVCLAQWPLAGDKLTEPEVLKAHLEELFEKYPALRLFTGDAIYAQRNLAELIVDSGHDYLFQIKANQPDILDAAQTSLGSLPDAQAMVKTVEKKGAHEKLVFFGSTWTMPNTFASGWVLPVVASCCESTGKSRKKKCRPSVKRGTS
jgi:hypothetical protein